MGERSLVDTFLQADYYSMYHTTKHSWRGKYKRIFALSTDGLTTLNPGSWEITNRWKWEAELVNATPEKNKIPGYFAIHIGSNGKKSETMDFSSEFRGQLLTDINTLLYKKALERDPKSTDPFKCRSEFPATKLKRNDKTLGILLRITECGVEELDFSSHSIRTSYRFIDISSIAIVTDTPNCFAIFHGTGGACAHIYRSDNRDKLISAITTNASKKIGVELSVANVTIENVRTSRLKHHGGDEDDITLSLCEFSVAKITGHDSSPVSRTFCLTEQRIVERDPATYNVVTTRPLKEIRSICRDPQDQQLFVIEYRDGSARSYLTSQRDTVLATILDCTRGCGNPYANITSTPFVRGFSMLPMNSPCDPEVEQIYLSILSAKEMGGLNNSSLQRIASAFNHNVLFAGAAFSEKDARSVGATMIHLLNNDMEHADEMPESIAVPIFAALRRLVATRIGFESFSSQQGVRPRLMNALQSALKNASDLVVFAALEVLNALTQPAFVANLESDTSHEQTNKRNIMSNGDFLEALIELLRKHITAGTGALIVSGIVDFLTFCLCDPYAQTTDNGPFDKFLAMTATLHRDIFRLFEHPCIAISRGAGMLMRSIIKEGSIDMARSMQYSALVEGAILRHLQIALFQRVTAQDPRQLANRNLSRELIRLWTASNDTCAKTLIRIFPIGLLKYLESPDAPPLDAADALDVSHQGKSTVHAKTTEANIFNFWRVRNELKRRENMAKAITRTRHHQSGITLGNWPMFFYQFTRDHSCHDLVWNHHTREELKEQIDIEVRNFLQDRELAGKEILSWNHVEFEVAYNSLNSEPKVADYYLRLLIETGGVQAIGNPSYFFNELYHHFFHEGDVGARALCLQCMSVVYRHHFEKIGRFRDTPYIIRLLQTTLSRVVRDRLVEFLASLLFNKDNAKQFIDSGGVYVMVDLITLVHTERHRAVTPVQNNMIAASDTQVRPSEKEWYYTIQKSKEKVGPVDMDEVKQAYDDGIVNTKTKVWAQGMDDWKPIEEVTQMKWLLLANGSAVFDVTQLGCLCLDALTHLCSLYPSRDVDGSIIRPIPKAKRQLCEAITFPHLIQVILTFDPSLVDRAATLLHMVIEDNISVLPKLYLTGMFYFVMMYPGSNILAISRLLKLTHSRQVFLEGETSRHSIMETMLPSAMACFLKNYPSDKFSEIYLGEFDTPEAIWNNEMRRKLIEKISLHLGTFPLRLQTCCKVVYQFVPMATINFAELEDELFCSQYYLRHLCNLEKFPNWPIHNQVELLQTVLMEWKKETEKKASTMTRDDAYEVLGLKSGEAHGEDAIRKCYYKKAQKYHPDKNPEGREMFEAIQKAYEILSSTSDTTGPDPRRLWLLIKTQVILYQRFGKDILSPYKYAGYSLLTKTMMQQTEDPGLFGLKTPLLPVCSELAYLTVKYSPLNADELRKELGLDILIAALNRCVDVLGPKSTSHMLAVEVSTNIIRTVTLLAAFESCRKAIFAQRILVQNIVRCLFYKFAPELVQASLHCCSQFCVDSDLQTMMLQLGLQLHLISFCMKYDYTLDESGVTVAKESNLQEMSNLLAKQATFVLGRSGGFLSGELSTPHNAIVYGMLTGLLTAYQVSMLSQENPIILLKQLTTNTETPYLIWNNDTRNELESYLDKKLEICYKTSEYDIESGTTFVYECLASELKIGGIYIRIYNLQPTFTLAEPTLRLQDFFNYLESESGEAKKLDANSTKYIASLTSIRMVLKSSQNLLAGHFGSETVLANPHYIQVLFSFLTWDFDTQSLALNIIEYITTNQACVDAIATASVLQLFAPLIYLLPARHLQTLKISQQLAANSKIVQELANNGAVLYVLNILCGGAFGSKTTGTANATSGPDISENKIVRVQAVSVLAKLSQDKVHGPKLSLALGKFLHGAFLATMKESPEQAVTLFDSSHENPELIWNDVSRLDLLKTVKRMTAEFYSAKVADVSHIWTPPDQATSYGDGEMFIGGVYLRLFMKQPNWQLRNPRQFLTALLDKFLDYVGKGYYDDDRLETVTQATVSLLKCQPAVADHAASTGQIPKLCPLIEHPERTVRLSTISIFNELCNSQACVENIGTATFIKPMMTCMTQTPESLLIIIDTLSKAFAKNNPERNSLIPQAQTAQLCPALLKLLDDGLPQVGEHAPAVKAVIVKTLKLMCEDPTHGSSIARFLEMHPTWASYRDQRHDLFLSHSGVAGLLTGPTSSNAAPLLLTGSNITKQTSTIPPPLTSDQ